MHSQDQLKLSTPSLNERSTKNTEWFMYYRTRWQVFDGNNQNRNVISLLPAITTAMKYMIWDKVNYRHRLVNYVTSVAM